MEIEGDESMIEEREDKSMIEIECEEESRIDAFREEDSGVGSD